MDIIFGTFSSVHAEAMSNDRQAIYIHECHKYHKSKIHHPEREIVRKSADFESQIAYIHDCKIFACRDYL